MEASLSQKPPLELNLRTVIRSLRLFALPASVLPVLVATAASAKVSAWRWDVLAASMLGAGLLNVAGNLINDYFDFRKGVDRRVDGDENRPGRVLVRGEMMPRQVLAEFYICLGVIAALVAYLSLACGPEIVYLAMAAVVAVYIYTGPPFAMKYRALGELNIFMVFGPLLMLGAAWAQTGQWLGNVALLSVPVGLITTAILVGNNARDREEDAGAGIRTIASWSEGKIAQAAYVVSVLGGVAGLAALAWAGIAPRALLAAPLLLVLVVKPLSAVIGGRRLPDIDAQTARFEAVLLTAVTAAYIAWPL